MFWTPVVFPSSHFLIRRLSFKDPGLGAEVKPTKHGDFSDKSGEFINQKGFDLNQQTW
jgi:hypothetical protein